MGFKNRLKYQLVGEAVRQPKMRRTLKKLVITVVAVGGIFIIAAACLVGYGLNQLNKMAANRPDPELVALNSLLSTKQIVLTEQQKQEIEPLLSQLDSGQAEGQQLENVKTQILANLNQQQFKSLKTWQNNMEANADGIKEVGRDAAVETISKYTGLPPEDSQRLFSSVAAWFGLNPTTDIAKSLQQQVENSQ